MPNLSKTVFAVFVLCIAIAIAASAQTLTTVYRFCPQVERIGGICVDGNNPSARVVQASDGNFYGTAGYGGANCSYWEQCGTVFKVTPQGALTTLYSFCSQPNCADGAAPYAGLIQATDGNFYGTTVNGGANGWGTVFEITPARAR